MTRRTIVTFCAGLAMGVMATGVGATASGLITGRDIKDGSVSGRDLKDGSLTSRDLSPDALASATTGPAGHAGQAGVPGPQGGSGPQGAPGSPGVDGQDGDDGQDGVDGIDGQDGEDGQDGTDGISGYELVEKTATVTSTVADNWQAHLFVLCPPGKQVLGGGGSVNENGTAMLRQSQPTFVPGQTGWFIRAKLINGTPEVWQPQMSVYAICATVD